MDLQTKTENRFILPNMTPDQIDAFVDFIHKAGHTTRQFYEANDRFKRNFFKSFLYAYEPTKKTA